MKKGWRTVIEFRTYPGDLALGGELVLPEREDSTEYTVLVSIFRERGGKFSFTLMLMEEDDVAHDPYSVNISLYPQGYDLGTEQEYWLYCLRTGGISSEENNA
jgi:hypothetical protein